MTEQPTTPFEISPVLKMYTQSIEAWKKNYETFLENAKKMQEAVEAPPTAEQAREPAGGDASTKDAALMTWQKSGEELFKRFVENQIELCHFFAGRWEQYLKVSGQISQCRSITELGTLQTSFLSQFASDYMQETQKLAQPMAEMMTNWTAEKKA